MDVENEGWRENLGTQLKLVFPAYFISDHNSNTEPKGNQPREREREKGEGGQRARAKERQSLIEREKGFADSLFDPTVFIIFSFYFFLSGFGLGRK